MTPDEVRDIVKEAVKEVLEKHPCWMSEDDRVMVRDMILGGKMVKRSILMAVAGGVLYLAAKIIMTAKGWTLFKP